MVHTVSLRDFGMHSLALHKAQVDRDLLENAESTEMVGYSFVYILQFKTCAGCFLV